MGGAFQLSSQDDLEHYLAFNLEIVESFDFGFAADKLSRS